MKMSGQVRPRTPRILRRYHSFIQEFVKRPFKKSTQRCSQLSRGNKN